MLLSRYLLGFFISIFAFNMANASPIKLNIAIHDGLRYLNSVQLAYGEFPTIFYPNISEPRRTQEAKYDSNIFTSAMIADAIYPINNPIAITIRKKVALYIKKQLNNSYGLWSYFTTHTVKPIYPITIYDLDDTVFASIVLKQNNIPFPNNYRIIKENKNPSSIYFTFIKPPFPNDVDCGVNANVLSYFQQKDNEVCQYINKNVASGKNCAQFYSQLDAYYLISRAYNSGVNCLNPSIQPITNYILKKINYNNGSVDNNPLETAIAINTLLNLKYQGPEIKAGINYLLSTQSRINGGWRGMPFWLWTGIDQHGNPILFGRSSSSALTTAIAIKAIYRFKDSLL